MKVFAHRGASTQYPEHTRAAFAHALAAGVHGVETDVQLTADGHLVCWHDATVNRTSNGRGPVRSHTLEQMRALDVTSWRAHGHQMWLPSTYGTPSNQLLTLDELTHMLVDAGQPVELAVEMKLTTATVGLVEQAVLAWLHRWGWCPKTGVLWHDGDATGVSVSIMSFSLPALEVLAAEIQAPPLCPLFDVRGPHPTVGWAGEHTETPRLLGPSADWLTHHPKTLFSWTQAGHTVRMWTVGTEQQVAAAQLLGVQQITVNDPLWALQNVPVLAAT